MARTAGSHSLRQSLVAKALDRHYDDGVSRVGFDLGAQATDMDVDETVVAEVAVAPYALEEHLSAEYLAGAGAELEEDAVFGLRQLDDLVQDTDLAGFREDLDLPISQLKASRARRAGTRRWRGLSGGLRPWPR